MGCEFRRRGKAVALVDEHLVSVLISVAAVAEEDALDELPLEIPLVLNTEHRDMGGIGIGARNGHSAGFVAKALRGTGLLEGSGRVDRTPVETGSTAKALTETRLSIGIAVGLGQAHNLEPAEEVVVFQAPVGTEGLGRIEVALDGLA